MRNLVSLFLLINGLLAFGQNNINTYNFAQLPQALMLNPSYDVETTYHLSIPLLGSHHINAESSGVTAYDIIGDNSIPFYDKVRNTVYQLEAKDYVLLNQRMEYFNAGQRLWSGDYLSYGMYEEFDLYSTLPTELLTLAFEGTSNLGKDYNIDNFVAQSSMVTVYHVGLQRKLYDELSVGGRFKIYNAAFDLSTTTNKGSFRTDMSDDGIYSHTLDDMYLRIRTAGAALKMDQDFKPVKHIETDSDGVVHEYYILVVKEGKEIPLIEVRDILGVAAGKLIGVKGIGVDLGFTYQYSDNLSMAASVNDFGFLLNSRQAQTYTYKGTYTTEGIAIEYDPSLPLSYLERIKDEFDENIPLSIDNKAYLSLRPFHVNGLLSYSFGMKRSNACKPYKNVSFAFADKIGAYAYAQYRPNHILYNANVFYERDFNDIIKARINYGINTYNYTNVGLSVAANFWKIRTYAGVNNIIGFTNLAKANNASVQFGLNVVLDSFRF